MLSNRLVFGALALACVTAAGAGGYLATRQASQATEAAAAPVNQALPPAAQETAASAAPAAPAAPIVATAPVAAPAAPAGRPATAPATSPGGSAPVARRDSERPRATPSAVTSSSTPTSTSRPSAPAASQPAQTATTDSVQAELPRTVPPSLNQPEQHTPATVDGVASSADARQVSASEPASVSDNARATVASADFDEVTVAADSVIGFELDRGISSERARVEDRVEARVARDVRVSRRVAIPAGTRALGSVTVVERGGKFKERARLGIRFHTLVLADGTRLPVQTDTIYRYGDGPGDSSAKKIGGGAVAGAILGAIIGGAKGAAVGATAGAGGGTAMVMSGERSAAQFLPGAEVTARVLSPVTVTIER